MSEAVVVAIISVASGLFLAAGAAIWRLATSNATLRAELDTTKAQVAKIVSDREVEHRDDERQWRAWNEIISTIRAEWNAIQLARLRRSNPRASRDEEP